jgi:hypothetical protein
MCGRAYPEGEYCLDGSELNKQRIAEDAWSDWRDPQEQFFCHPPDPEHWAIDFRCRTFCSSMTSYEFGTPPNMPPTLPPEWAPVSRLNFPLDSCWYGLQLAKEAPNWCFRLEWMMAGRYIEGELADFDWYPPNPDGSFTDLGFARERFTEGQMIDVNFKRKMFEPSPNFPVTIWPTIGFRWQRLDLTAFDATQVKSDNEWLSPPWTYEDDVITFNQQYWIGYAGAQLRGQFTIPGLRPIVWTLQGDWGHTEAYNVDHHLIREGDMFSMNRTSGNCWHAALTVEALLSDRISLGVEADQLYINTQGTHRWLNEPLGIDQSWDNGTIVTSRQTWITAFLRIRM